MRKRTIPFLALAAAGLILASSTGADASASIFRVVPSVDTATAPVSNDLLSSTASITPRDGWAVGFVSKPDTTEHTLAEHWNGTRWSATPSPDGTSGSQLAAVAAVSSKDVWAVGLQNSNLSIEKNATLIEHWNGTAWSIVPSPNAGTQGDRLTGVAAVSANDVWATGYFSTPTEILPLFEHWNGKTWSVVSVPNVPNGVNFVRAISAVSTNDVWAVGSDVDSHSGNTDELILHWNGTQWSVLPTLPIGQTSLEAVHAVSSKDVWAVGTSLGDNGGESRNLALHWNGTAWSKVPVPNVGNSVNPNFLSGVTALSSRDVWAVGAATGGADGVNRSLIEHWNGSAWSIVPSPSNPNGSNSTTLAGVAAVAPGNVTAVGTWNSAQQGNPGLRTLVVTTSRG
ncbi:hypothetical protein ACFOY4_09260 [Actinomadura syzygii]|uniref:Exo-alpha-sialidase n=1 Tax=Actinomadura syzygii TaxID=1427538 RepID=A0A5D0UEE5_9ACTN|nr:hypothetical protein [Actinomadura syzygii]TYC15985.1 hypothetical protein FXF65_11670 [Actinomadura syzygii]